MADVFSARQRSKVMQAVRSRGNRTTEVAFAKGLRASGVKGWRRHLRVCVPCSSGSAGTKDLEFSTYPDFVFAKQKVAVFLDGCFWHSCPWHRTRPRHRAGFWRKKLTRNVARDRETNQLLRKSGWTVVRIWEHRLQNDLPGCMAVLLGALNRH